MATQAEIEIVSRMSNAIPMRNPKIRKRDKYYKGSKRLATMGISTPPELRHLETVVNWCRVAVDSLGERLDLEGFRTGDADLDAELWRWWKHNRMQFESDGAHLEALIQGACFIVIGVDPVRPDLPRFTIESPSCMQVETDDTGRTVTAATRIYTDVEGHRFATLYLPNSTISFQENTRWEETARDDHNLGVVPVVPLINRSRVTDRFGESEMTDVMGIVDAACRTATNLAAAGETLAVPSRYILGASQEDFVDSVTGEPVPVWEAYMGRLNALSNEDAKVVQLSGADLRNFTDTLNTYAGLVSSLTGLPTHYLGLVTQNPASADAIRSAESRHVKRAERKQESFGSGWVRAMEIAHLWIRGALPADVQMETVWRDASTPTIAAKADAVVKLVQANVLPQEAAWIELGYSPEKRDLYRSFVLDDPLERLLASVGAPTPATSEQANVFGTFVRSGATPETAASAAGVDGLEFTGEAPVTLRPLEDDAPAPAPAQVPAPAGVPAQVPADAQGA